MLWVRLGVTDLNNMDFQQGVFSKKLVRHPEYGGGDESVPSNFTFDLMLIQLEREVELTDYVQTACLPGSAEDFLAGDTCVVSGWGETTNVPPKKGSDRLKYTLIELQSWEECNSTESVFG